MKKFISLIMSICLVVSSITAICIPASAATSDPTTKRAIVISSPSLGSSYSDDITRYTYTHNNMKAAFVNAGITTSDVLYTQGNSLSSYSTYINNALGSADDDDISYIYFHCHGNVGFMNVNNSMVTYSALKTQLDAINGHIVLIIDSCHSGSSISSDSDSTNAEAIIESFFTDTVQTDGTFEGNTKYTIYCSALSDQNSYSYLYSFTFSSYGWAMAIGYDMANQCAISGWAGDTNGDDVISAPEFHNVASSYAEPLITNSGVDQSMCYYAHNDMESVFYKDYRLGDVNLDYVINGQDTLALQQHIINLSSLSTRGLELADVNADGNVNNKDVLTLKKYIVGIEDTVTE